MTKLLMNKLRESLFLNSTYSWDRIFLSLCGLILKILSLRLSRFFGSGIVVSKNNLEIQQSHNVQEVQIQPF